MRSNLKLVPFAVLRLRMCEVERVRVRFFKWNLRCKVYMRVSLVPSGKKKGRKFGSPRQVAVIVKTSAWRSELRVREQSDAGLHATDACWQNAAGKSGTRHWSNRVTAASEQARLGGRKEFKLERLKCTRLGSRLRGAAQQ